MLKYIGSLFLLLEAVKEKTNCRCAIQLKKHCDERWSFKLKAFKKKIPALINP